MKNIHLYRLQRLCDFATSKKPNKYYQYKILIDELDLPEEDYSVDEEAIDIADNLKKSLVFIVEALNDPEESLQINDIVNRGYYFSTYDGIKLSKFRWDEKRKYVTDSDEKIKMHYLIIDFLEDIAALPFGSLRVCKNIKCGNPFMSLHKNKEYCCATCRNSTNTRNMRIRKRNVRS